MRYSTLLVIGLAADAIAAPGFFARRSIHDAGEDGAPGGNALWNQIQGRDEVTSANTAENSPVAGNNGIANNDKGPATTNTRAGGPNCEWHLASL